MTSSEVQIRPDRLKTLLDGINKFGFNRQTGGYNRVGFSDMDIAVRSWFREQMKESGLDVSVDAAGNLFGRLGTSGKPCVMIGSHLDTVPEGGAFDGALGAAIGLECVRSLKDHGIEPDFPVVAVATSEEEGRFGGMLGSQTISGQLAPGWVEMASDADGVSLVEAMAAQGYSADTLREAAWPNGSIRAFLELHIEQGPVLESEQLSIGIVESISGVLVLGVSLEGTANHSGTTPMPLRADAFAGLAEVGVAIPTIIKDIGTDQSRVTIGKVDLSPNFPHTIPGRADFTIIIRDTSAEVMATLRSHIEASITDAAARNSLKASIEERSYLPPESLDGSVRQVLLEETKRLGYSHTVMPSGAGHDAQTMQAFCPSGLVFVPSRNGISHAPEEWTDWTDIEKGAQVMLNAVLRLSKGD
ncbi:N-carbamoyl-L-amino-acid hydrolase [Cohaesibacter sp. ES.047]|uniref:Zn-dependent hydrolase n=1 Tax=Cohaesibacter sp. ES.047 TaxID=1798205 RepID=UPI000BB75114|nr:Zn-dependent hydrolase [Cohaesibacter sp. ES.047]SNY92980.1 N-carbamoyl-L-amino-acid hydrolase [Cohaesibacter sp. ES.047]